MSIESEIKELLSGTNSRWKSPVIRKNPDYLAFLNEKYSNIPLNQEIYLFERNLDNPPICPVCNGAVSFHSEKQGYRKTCSATCLNQLWKDTDRLESIKEKTKATCIVKYGTENPLQNEEIKAKKVQTNLIRYGVENPTQNAEIRAKQIETCLENNGVEFPFQSAEIREKSKETNLIRYGVENISQYEPIKIQKEITTFKNYGVKHNSQSDVIKEKKKIKSLQNYDVEYPIQSPIIQYKVKQTNLIRYGVENPFANEQIKEQIKQTNLKKYGTEYPTQNVYIKEKTQATNLLKYGVEYAIQSPIVQYKVRQTNLIRYGVEYFLQNKEVRENIKQTNLIKYGVENPFANKEIQYNIRQTNLIRYGVEYPSQLSLIYNRQRLTIGLLQETIDILDNKEKFTELLNQYGTIKLCKLLNISDSTVSRFARRYGIRDGLHSNLERSVKDWLSTLPYMFKTDRKILHGYEIDFYCEEKQFGIELNGLAYHGENIGHKDKHYHLWKYNECARQSIRLLHIFEDEWYERQAVVKNIILTQLGLTEKGTGARKLNIHEISSQQANKFFETYHIQGKTNSLQVCLGAYNGENLVGVMGFGHPTRQSIYQYELKRYCTNHKVYAGLASRLFQHFVKHYNPESIVSFCDKRFFLGKSYVMMGFVNDGEIPPDYQYTDYISRFHKSLFRKSQIEKKFNIDITGKTEKELMQELRFDRIWDIGKIRFVWWA